MQLANELKGRAIRLRQEALSRVILSLGGTKATSVVEFLIDSFGGVEDYAVAKAAVLAEAPDPDDVDLGDTEEDESSKTDSSKSKDVCILDQAKPCYPIDSDSLSATGVPSEFISDNLPSGPTHQSSYNCLYGGCDFNAQQKASTYTHIHRRHLGVAIHCPLCTRSWWSSRPFIGHMEKCHRDDPDKRWTPLSAVDIDTREAAEAAEVAAKLPAVTPLM